MTRARTYSPSSTPNPICIQPSLPVDESTQETAATHPCATGTAQAFKHLEVSQQITNYTLETPGRKARQLANALRRASRPDKAVWLELATNMVSASIAW